MLLTLDLAELPTHCAIPSSRSPWRVTKTELSAICWRAEGCCEEDGITVVWGLHLRRWTGKGEGVVAGRTEHDMMTCPTRGHRVPVQS